MKKFTNISNSTVGQPKEIKIDEKVEKVNNFKHQILKLMDDFLRIQSYGSARPEIMIPTSIVGKELFIEALQDLLKEKESKEIIQILESLKEKTRDWQAIDEKIDEITEYKINKKRVKKINDHIEKWGHDDDLYENMSSKFAEKLPDSVKLETFKTLEYMMNNSSSEFEIDKLKKLHKLIENSIL